MYEQDLAINNLQWLMGHKTQLNLKYLFCKFTKSE